MALTLQEKLALSLTSWGSLNALAGAVGVSPRTVTRWLKEGQPDGVKAIPAAARQVVDQVFSIHKDVTRDQARAHGVPYNAARPVFMERRPMRTGELGDRVFVDRTEYIERPLRMEIMRDAQQTRRFVSASVQSEVDLYQYFQNDEASNATTKTGMRFVVDRTPKARAKTALRSFVAKEKRDKGRIVDVAQPFNLYTRYADISFLRDPDDMRGVVDIEEQLRRKHEPAVGQPGNVLANKYLYQLLPQQYHERAGLTQTTKTKSSKAKRKPARKAAVKRKGR